MVLFQFRQSVPIEEGVIAMQNMMPRPIRSPLITHLYHKQFLVLGVWMFYRKRLNKLDIGDVILRS